MIEVAKKAASRLNFEFPYTIEDWIKNGMLMENYHKHTTWSNFFQIDSATNIDDFIKLSKDYGCKCYFSGEHGYPGEWLNVYDICKNTDMKFVYSAEVYWVKDINSVVIENYEDKNGNIKVREKRDNTNCHMVIVARNYNAIRKLNYLITRANDEGYYYKPRIDLNMLFELSPEDVYITSACVAGWKYEDATEIWYQIWQHFGDSFFLEYQTHHTNAQKELNKKILNLSRELGIQTIIGLDTHYLNEEDKVKRENLLKRKGLHYDDEDDWNMDFPNGAEVFNRMKEQGIVPEEDILYSMMNTHIFINGCQDFEYDAEFKIPIMDKYKDLSYEERCEVLKKILMEQYEKEEEKSEDRIKGIEYEYNEIIGSKTADYFLDNYEIIKRAVNEFDGKLTTTSRGSAASYYSSKLLGFTTMDRFNCEVPIYPERFITKDRVLSSHSMPDIDLNCSSQEPFVSATRNIFGEHTCYPLLAVGKFGEKSGFKMYADVSGIDPTTANDITTMIDSYNEAVKEADDELKDSIEMEEFITDKKYLKIYNESKPYQGIIEQAKCHACGFMLYNGNIRQKDVVGYGDIRYEIGLIRCHSESTGRSTLVVNAEGGLLDSHGYVKDDFLIVDVVGIIAKLYDSIGMKVPTVSELRKMVTNDEPTWDLYAKGITCCLNQCEKKGTTERAKKYKPKNIKELAAFIAGIRPGFKSLINGFLDRIEYTNGEKAIDDLLEDCFSYMLYQEAVMKIFSYLGIPMKDSYDTIKKISKKKLKGEALKHVEDTLKSHWLENIGNLDNFEPVYKVIKDSARYSFNAPHALSMANDSLYEAWMKAHHTSKFYEITMNHYQDKNDKKKVAELQKEAVKFFNYKVGKYEFGKDNSKITIDDEEKIIYPSLASVKDIGIRAVEELYEISKNDYDNLIDVYIATGGTKINSSVFRKLIKIGYFHMFGSIKKNLLVCDLVDEWKGTKWLGKKTISKEYVSSLGIDISDFATDKLDSGNISSKQYRIFDWVGLVKKLSETIPDEEYSISEIIKFQIEILGYVDYKDPEKSNQYIIVTELDTKYSPKFKAVCLNNGQECEMRVSKNRNPKNKEVITSFSDIPFENGDILFMKKCKKKPRQRKTDSGWEVVPNEFNWWILSYEKNNKHY